MPENINILVWNSTVNQKGRRYFCGYCGVDTSPNEGYVTSTHNNKPKYQGIIGICTNCNRPSYLLYHRTTIKEQVPGELQREKIRDLPNEIEQLYSEALISAAAGAHTSAVLTCRKILMHVAVSKKAEENKGFAYYVNYMAKQGYLPPEGKKWAQYIVDRANEANHEIEIMYKNDSDALILLTTRMLQFIFELSGSIPAFEEQVVEANTKDSNDEG